MRCVALYARVSTEHQEKEATIGSQIAALTERAKADGEVVLPGDIYADEGYSGSTLVRPALERLRDRAAEGALDVLYVLSPDRLARRYAYQVVLLEELARHGARVVFLSGTGGGNAEEELLVQVQGMIAEYERARILERSRRGKLHKAKLGQVNPLSGAPYGYQYVCRTENEPAEYRPLVHEAKVVRSVFRWFVEEQLSIRGIARRLTAEGVPTRRGNASWQTSTIGTMLKNPAYMGEAAYNKTEQTAAWKRLRTPQGRKVDRRLKEKGSGRRRPEEQWIRIPVPGLVSADIFWAAQEQLGRNRQLAARNARSRRYLLGGLVVCARCGYGYYGRTMSRVRRSDGQRLSYYFCHGTDTRYFGGQKVCSNRLVRVDQLDRYVWESVSDMLRDPQRVSEEWTRRAADGGFAADVRRERDEAQRFLRRQESTLRRLQDAYEAGVLELSELTERTDRVRERIRRGRRELDEVERRLREAAELEALAGKLEAFAEQVRARLEDMDWPERQQLIRTLVSRVEIDTETITIVYRIPTPDRRMDDARVTAANTSRADVAGCIHGVKMP